MSTLTINPADLYGKFPLWEIKVNNIPFDREFFENNKLWKDNLLTGQNYTYYPSERKEYIEGSSQELDTWLSNFKKENDILEKVINNFENYDSNIEHFFREFPIEDKGLKPSYYIRKHCHVLYRVMKDEGGYKMEKHFDNRAVFGNMFFNLVDNGDTGTEFFNTFSTGYKDVIDSDTNLMYKGPTKKGEGIWFMNNSHLLHSIKNRGNINRYVVNILVYFSELTR